MAKLFFTWSNLIVITGSGLMGWIAGESGSWIMVVLACVNAMLLSVLVITVRNRRDRTCAEVRRLIEHGVAPRCPEQDDAPCLFAYTFHMQGNNPPRLTNAYCAFCGRIYP
jgi:hypothetical protein